MVEGIITKTSLVRPKLVKTVQYNSQKNDHVVRSYRDATSAVGAPTLSMPPVRDDDKTILSWEYGLSVYKDHQVLTVQEMPERAPAGQLPRSVEVVCEHDLADACKPGDRVQIVGVYRALPSVQKQRAKGVFRTVVLANQLRPLGKGAENSIHLTVQDVENIQAVAERPDCFEMMARSLAPSIYGHEFVKKALLLQLLGGVEKNLDNGTHIRGDINVMMIGDPSTAKSQLLRFVLNIAPLAISTSGRGSSGVGLTAAVTNDPETNERRLEAGAMVLADRGIVCIDEFDKMSEDDRVAIHEVMEQGSCTINKAGIHTSLNARCSVLAAANPVYGQYNRQKKPSENIALPDSLLSRFDLMFIVLDNLDPEHDRLISSHVLRMHRYRKADALDLGEEGEGHVGAVEASDPLVVPLAELEDGDLARQTPVTQKFSSATGSEEIFTIEFIKKFLMYAKARIVPILQQEAVQHIISRYAALRSREDTKTLPVTPRTLETMIRLATAHAKCRLSRAVELVDAIAACDVMNFALYNEVGVVESSAAGAAPTTGMADERNESDKRPVPGDGLPVPAEESGDKRQRALLVMETDQERGSRFRKLFRKVMADRKIEHCEMMELIPWLNEEQSKRAVDVYADWHEAELWPLLTEWAEEDDPNGVMIERSLGEIFLLG